MEANRPATLGGRHRLRVAGVLDLDLAVVQRTGTETWTIDGAPRPAFEPVGSTDTEEVFCELLSRLAERGFISKADIDRKTAQRDAANARLNVARAQLGENSARIGRLDIRAPASGLLLARNVEPGQVVGGGGAVLFRIAKGGEMEMRAMLAEADLAKLSVGSTAQVTPVGTTKAFTGQIWQMPPVIEASTRQGAVRIALAYNEALRPGGFATATIRSGAQQAPLLPESAVQSDEQGNYVFVVTPQNKVERRVVKVGSVSDAGITIVSGLTGREQVVLTAGAFLNPGESVVPVRTKSN